MEITEIKAQLTIDQVLAHYNLQPTAKGALQCPLHEQKPGNRKKTLQIYTDTNRYQCFHKDCTGGNGDVIDFIEKMDKITKHEAINKAKTLLGEQSPITSDASSASVTLRQTRHSDTHDAHSDVVETSGENRSSGGVTTSGSGSAERADRSTFEVRSADQMHYQDEHLQITVLGGIRLEGLDRMRSTLKLVNTKYPHQRALRHTLDLYNDDQLQKLIRKTAERLELGTSKIDNSLHKLTEHLESYRYTEIEKSTETKPTLKPLTEEERQAAITFLQTPELMARTNALLGQSGIIGEQINRQILWLVYSSRKRSKPLHVISLGASGTGKTYLQEKVSRFIPEAEKFTFTASTENAFYYLEPYDLCHKVVLIEDMDGVQYLLYPLRELQTKQWISKIVPIKDHQNNNKTRKLEVYGPICLSGTTTKEHLYEDNANRCLLLHLDGSTEQQEAIMDYQRKHSAGKVDSQGEQEAAHQLEHLQRVLEPVKVINPYAEYLRIPTRCFKPLRTHDHYLQFIETVTWYHQYQREERADENGEVYIETTLEDIAVANQLMKEVLLTKSDELTKSQRQFFEQMKGWLKEQKQTSFYVKALRSHFRMYPMKANRYVKSLEQYGYLKKTGGNRKQGYEYEVTDWEDYQQLQNGLNVLDDLLEKLKTMKKASKTVESLSIT